MKTKLISIFCTVVLLLGLAGCQATKPKDSGTGITIGEAIEFSSYDPFGIMDGLGFNHYTTMVYETLVKFEDGTAKPSLAESWENDGNTWTFHLKEGVRFTDGTVFDAEAVKTNIEKIQEFVGDYISYYGAVSRITSVEVVDSQTVRFVYDAPYYAVLQELSASCFGIMSPIAFENGNNPYGSTLGNTYGTGPYQLLETNCVPGKTYTFTRNAAWSGEVSGPESFTVKIIPDADSRLMALQAGEIDILYGSYQITYDMLNQVEKDKNLTTVFSDKSYTTRNVLFNASSPILKDREIRIALQHGVNKEEIINAVLYGRENRADTLFTVDTPHCDVSLAPYKYDTELANKVLDTAGWAEKNAQGIRMKDGKPLRLEAIYQISKPVDEQIFMALKGQMAELGIDLNIQGYETMTWFEKGMAGEFDLSINDTYGFPQDPHVFLTAMLYDGLDRVSQQELAQKQEIDSHIMSMMQTVDEAVISEDYRYILTTLHEEAINLPISYAREMAIYNSSVIGGISFDDNPNVLNVSDITPAGETQ